MLEECTCVVGLRFWRAVAYHGALLPTLASGTTFLQTSDRNNSVQSCATSNPQAEVRSLAAMPSSALLHVMVKPANFCPATSPGKLPPIHACARSRPDATLAGKYPQHLLSHKPRD